MTRTAAGAPASPGATRAPSTGSLVASPDAVLRDEQTLLAAAVERLRDTTGIELAAAWALRGEDEPYMVAAAFEGEPPASPESSAWREVAGWTGARLVEPPSPLVKSFPGRRAIAAVPVGRAGEAAVAVLCVASDKPHPIRPRALALLDATARRLATPLAAARAARRLTELDARLRRLDRLAALGTVAAEVAHEVRNPLVSVKTFLQLLPERRDDPEFATGFLEVATGELARVERLLGALIAYPRARAEEGGADPAAALAHVGELLRHLSQTRGVTLVVEAPEALPRVPLDGDALRQVLLNLAMNAVEVTPDGGRVSLTARAEDGVVVVTVSDTGPGVPEAERQRIFEAFHSTRGDDHGGLGLSISRRIVVEAGGSVTVEDAPGAGARFRVTLPAEPGAAAPAP
jgi:signal transduction histidine kinase